MHLSGAVSLQDYTPAWGQRSPLLLESILKADKALLILHRSRRTNLIDDVELQKLVPPHVTRSRRVIGPLLRRQTSYTHTILLLVQERCQLKH